eukprot:3239462-Prymnesium_polylepis.1
MPESAPKMPVMVPNIGRELRDLSNDRQKDKRGGAAELFLALVTRGLHLGADRMAAHIVAPSGHSLLLHHRRLVVGGDGEGLDTE